MKIFLKWLNTSQVSKSLRVFLVVFSRGQYWTQRYWEFSWTSRKLVLNPVNKTFSGTMINSALMMMRTECLGDFGSLNQNKCELLCLVRNIGQAGKWETCPRKQWLKWIGNGNTKDPQKLFVRSGKDDLLEGIERISVCLFIRRKIEEWLDLHAWASPRGENRRVKGLFNIKKNRIRISGWKPKPIEFRWKVRHVQTLWCEWLTTGTNYPWNEKFPISWCFHIKMGGRSRQDALAKTGLFGSV